MDCPSLLKIHAFKNIKEDLLSIVKSKYEICLYKFFLIILKKYYKNLDIIRLYYSGEFYEAICDVNKDVYKF